MSNITKEELHASILAYFATLDEHDISSMAAALETLAASAFSGNYADLAGKPTLAKVATTGAYTDITGKPTLAAVATTGSYADLANKPTIPAAYTLPIATTTVLGGIKGDGKTILIDAAGIASAAGGGGLLKTLSVFHNSLSALSNGGSMLISMPYINSNTMGATVGGTQVTIPENGRYIFMVKGTTMHTGAGSIYIDVFRSGAHIHRIYPYLFSNNYTYMAAHIQSIGAGSIITLQLVNNSGSNVMGGNMQLDLVKVAE